MSFVPEFQGQLVFDRPLPDDFIERIQHRVETGLLVPGRRARAHYRVVSSGHDEIAFAAEGFLTAYAIGLNRVAVRRTGASQLDYQVSYWDWTRYVVAHGAMIGVCAAGLYSFVPEVRRPIAGDPHGPTVFWSLISFFALAWPWLLTMIHKESARRALEGILRETMAGPTPEALAKQA